MSQTDSAKWQTALNLDNDDQVIAYSLKKYAKDTSIGLTRLPYAIRVLLENAMRNIDGFKVCDHHIQAIASWESKAEKRAEIPYMPSRVVMQDFTGVPAVVDMAAMRDAFAKEGGDPNKINPMVDTALVIDHSVQVDHFGFNQALQKNVALEYERNKERYGLLKWAQSTLNNFAVVPPGMGIIHQVNLEYLAQVVMTKNHDGVGKVAYPDTLVGTDSHTTMINGIGVMGWGVGGIEAEAVMLGQPYYMILPDVIGVKLTGSLSEGVTATDMVLHITHILRSYGVVGKFVEFFGDGVANLTLADRATIANMAPEYGATMGFFPVDRQTLDYLEQSNRGHLNDMVEKVLSEQLLYRDQAEEEPEYTDVIEINLSEIDAALAGPKRPQDHVSLHQLKTSFEESLGTPVKEGGFEVSDADKGQSVSITLDGEQYEINHGTMAIAAITSCTNTSNPYVMMGAGLLAKNAVMKGLSVKPFVKTSLAPGSQVVTDYLTKAGLLSYLEDLSFNIVGYGCTTCIGNSGQLIPEMIEAVSQNNLVVASVLSGNRNFEGRVNPHVKANYLASPMLVVAYAIAGRVDFDLEKEPLGESPNGEPVYLKDIWPSNADIDALVHQTIKQDMFQDRYKTIFDGTDDWKSLHVPEGDQFKWKQSSSYIRCPSFFDQFAHYKGPSDIVDARVLIKVGDSVTTDHISPAGAILNTSPAGRYLQERGVSVSDFNSYGSRRGNHEVMMRGTFANVRLRNQLADGKEGCFTRYIPENEIMSVYDASRLYQKSQTPLVVLAGKEYGTGSSRDWAAKGTYLLGIKAVIAESYERIHRSNLVGMGVLPLQYLEGQSASSLGLDGTEVFTIRGLRDLSVGQQLTVQARSDDGTLTEFQVKVRLDGAVELSYYQNGGILQTVLKNMLKVKETA